jgi:hypothetical protein
MRPKSSTMPSMFMSENVTPSFSASSAKSGIEEDKLRRSLIVAVLSFILVYRSVIELESEMKSVST